MNLKEIEEPENVELGNYEKKEENCSNKPETAEKIRKLSRSAEKREVVPEKCEESRSDLQAARRPHCGMGSSCEATTRPRSGRARRISSRRAVAGVGRSNRCSTAGAGTAWYTSSTRSRVAPSGRSIR